MCYIVLLIALLSVCTGCSRSDGQHLVVPVDVDACLSGEDVSIFDMFSAVELIHLDESYPVSNGVHTGASYITYDGNNFYILDARNYTVNVYGSDGAFRAHVDKVGRGPGEYTMGYQIEYNSDSGEIEILNPMGKMLRFDSASFEYVSELNFMGRPLSSHNFCRVGNDYIIYTSSSHEEDKLYRLYAETSEVVSYGYRPPEYLSDYISPQAPFFKIDDTPCIFRPYDGLVYAFDVSGVSMSPLIEWDFGKYRCRLKDIPPGKNNREYYAFILDYSQSHIASFINIKSSADKIFASVIFKGETYTVYHELDSGETLFFLTTSEGMKFLPEIFDGKTMYKYVDSSSLKEFVCRDILDGSSKAAYDAVLSEDGGAIIKYTLK